MKLKILTILVILKLISGDKKDLCAQVDATNGAVFNFVLANHMPFGFLNKSVTILNVVELASDECAKYCCLYAGCDSVVINDTQCILIHCEKFSNCRPVKMDKYQPSLFYLVINTSNKFVDSDTSVSRREEIDKSTSNCEFGVIGNCPANEFCYSVQEETKSGLCVCDPGYTRKNNQCAKDVNRESNQGHIENPDSKRATKKIIPVVNRTPKAIEISTRSSKSKFPSSTKPTTSSTTLSTTSKIPEKKSSIDEVQKLSKKYNMSVDAGPDLDVKVSHSSPYFNMVDVVSIRGAVKHPNIANPDKLTYNWRRLPESLATGTIVNNSFKQPTLLLSNLLQGQYIFELTVTSPDGQVANDTVKLNVVEVEVPDKISLNLVNIILKVNVYRFTEKEKDNFAKRMAHILEKHLSFSQCTIEVQSVSCGDNNDTHIVFYAKMYNTTTHKSDIISSGLLETELKYKVMNHKFILDYTVVMFQSRICHNTCGGHGHCDQKSHRCKCNFPWFNNVIHEHQTGFTNCDMHTMVVISGCAVGFFLLIMFVVVCKKFYRVLRRRSSYGKKVLQYHLLEDTES